MDREHRGRGDGNRYRVEVLVGIVGYRVVHGRVDDDIRRNHKDGVTVGYRSRSLAHADIATGTAGYVCADAAVDRIGAKAAPAVSCRNCRRRSFMTAFRVVGKRHRGTPGASMLPKQRSIPPPRKTRYNMNVAKFILNWIWQWSLDISGISSPSQRKDISRGPPNASACSSRRSANGSKRSSANLTFSSFAARRAVSS